MAHLKVVVELGVTVVELTITTISLLLLLATATATASGYSTDRKSKSYVLLLCIPILLLQHFTCLLTCLLIFITKNKQASITHMIIVSNKIIIR